MTVTECDSVSVVQFAERKILEELSIAEIGEELYAIVDGKPGIRILLSFGGVEHLSSAALGVLITLNKKVSDLNGTLKLSDITPPIFEVFKITSLNKLFDIYDTREAALSAF
ncbi:MAG: STAS domain-containing protein [Phycisphaerae bacterium]